jgi:hypothetical protein
MEDDVSPARRYSLRSSPGRFLTGSLPDGRQVLMGVSCPGFELFYFHADGKFLSVEPRQLTHPPVMRGGIYFFDSQSEQSLKVDVDRWSTELDFRESPIEVCRFSANHVSIEDFAPELCEFQERPEQFDDERQSMQEWQQRWIDDGMFVLWWGDDLWINRNGEIVHC